LRRDLLLEEIEALTNQVRRIEHELNHQAGRSPAVARLRSIPGVGARTAEAVAVFSDDPHRFRDAQAVGRYFGLVPSQDQSGERNRLGPITREGPAVVRQLVAESTWQALRRSPMVGAYFERVRRGDPQRKKIALVASAHYLVRVMWPLLKRGSHQVGMSDEGLMAEGIEDCLCVVIKAITKWDLPAEEVLAWCSAMLDTDRMGFIAREPLQSLRNHFQTTAAR
jgi:hypothetical protein